ncbi:MAG: histidine phosphatase family protein [Erysipelotrichaceae bacterium]|nr:histidine phosphatase family protein [Erysipelotrichaceae bacterium]
MNIYLARHGQTRYNKKKLMQGLTDEPLNETGRKQAKDKNEVLKGIKFDAIYTSPLKRAIETASIIADTDESKIIKDERIIEVDFGKYELRNYFLLGLRMTLYWAFPEFFKNPESVESTDSMIKRASSFLKELENKDYDNVLIVCHGGIIRALRGYLEDSPNGLKWRPKPKNSQIFVYEVNKSQHKLVKII